MAIYTLPTKDGLIAKCYPDVTKDEAFECAMKIAPELIKEMRTVLDRVKTMLEEQEVYEID